MSPRVPTVTPKKVIKALERTGFVLRRIRGSHYHMTLLGEKRFQVTVPMHKGDLKPGTLHAIIKQAGLTVEEFIELL